MALNGWFHSEGKLRAILCPVTFLIAEVLGKKKSTTAVRVSMTHAEVTRTVLDKNLWERHAATTICEEPQLAH